MHKLIPIVLFVCAPAWAQSGLPSAQDSGSKPQAAESPQTAPDSDKKPAPDQIPQAPLADSTKLEPIQIKKAAYPYEAQEKKLQGEVVVRILVSETGDVETAEIVSAIPFWPSLRWMQSRNGSLNRSSRTANQWKFQRSYRSTSRFLKTSMMKVPRDTKAAVKRVRISAGVSGGLLVHRVQPVYPPEARQARVQGRVVLHAIINKEGRIANLQLVSGPKELAQAAIGAVQQWRYRPYLLMGDPVEVDTEIQVNFQLR